MPRKGHEILNETGVILICPFSFSFAFSFHSFLLRFGLMDPEKESDSKKKRWFEYQMSSIWLFLLICFIIILSFSISFAWLFRCWPSLPISWPGQHAKAEMGSMTEQWCGEEMRFWRPNLSPSAAINHYQEQKGGWWTPKSKMIFSLEECSEHWLFFTVPLLIFPWRASKECISERDPMQCDATLAE